MNAKLFRRLLRRQSTTAEKILWFQLRNRKFQDLKFRRQHSIDQYTVDFYCEKLKLILEVDGSIHNNLGQSNYDYERDDFLKSQGYMIYRVDNDSVINHPDVVLADLQQFIECRLTT